MMYPGARLLIVICAVVAFVALAVGCTPTADRPEGRLAFEAWAKANVTEIEIDLSNYPGGDRCAGYRADLRLVVIDSPCIWRHTDDPQRVEDIRVHEIGHAVDVALGFPQGATPIGVERGAQCVSAVVLGYSTPGGDPAAGYWDCPDAEVERTRTLMQGIGAW